MAGTQHSQFASFLQDITHLTFNMPILQVWYYLGLSMKINPPDLSLMEGQNRPVEGEAL